MNTSLGLARALHQASAWTALGALLLLVILILTQDGHHTGPAFGAAVVFAFGTRFVGGAAAWLPDPRTRITSVIVMAGVTAGTLGACALILGMLGWNRFSERCAATLLAVLLPGTAALAACLAKPDRRFEFVGVLGALSTVVAAGLTLGELWFDRNIGRYEMMTALAFWAGGLVPGLWTGAGLVRLRNDQAWMRILPLIPAVPGCVLILMAVGGQMRESVVVTWSLAAGLLTAAALIYLGIVHRTNTSETAVPRAESGLNLPGVQATCAACGTGLAVPVGDSACPTCGLRFRLLLAEPACTGCGYLLLHRAHVTQCPECGLQRVPDRFASPTTPPPTGKPPPTMSPTMAMSATMMSAPISPPKCLPPFPMPVPPPGAPEVASHVSPAVDPQSIPPSEYPPPPVPVIAPPRLDALHGPRATPSAPAAGFEKR